jgi:hypothetical protein
MKSIFVLSLATVAGLATATPYVVDSLANASGDGVGLATVSLTMGQAFTVSASSDDLWSLGALPRFCDADGLTGDRYATATDDSGETVGTLIGQNYGNYSQANLSVAYGTLVGRIDAGDFFVIGTNYAGVASATGTLYLYNWDAPGSDNSGSITANVDAVPEPASMAVLGLGLAAAARKRRK